MVKLIQEKFHFIDLLHTVKLEYLGIQADLEEPQQQGLSKVTTVMGPSTSP